jgi:hypothetical protein
MQRVAAFAFVAFVLFTAADIPATSELAVAFAYLILLSAAFAVGPDAFARISSLVGGAAAPTVGGGGGRPSLKS